MHSYIMVLALFVRAIAASQQTLAHLHPPENLTSTTRDLLVVCESETVSYYEISPDVICM